MLNVVWVLLMVVGVAVASVSGHVQEITQSLFGQARDALMLGIDLAAIVAFWFGISRVAEQAGLMEALARLLSPLLRRFFPEIPEDSPVLGSMTMNIAANALGLGNAATPFGLKAMKELRQLEPAAEAATPMMVTFLALNSACPNLIPANIIALRAAAGSSNPGETIVASILTTFFAFFVSMTANRYYRRKAQAQLP